MPSPSCQNLRSAPQKHPSPKIAVSRPCGYGPFRARPLTWWRLAVAIGAARPGKASPGAGMAVFLNRNIGVLLALSKTAANFRKQAPRQYRASARYSQRPIGKLQRRLVSRVADQRLLFAAEQDEDHAESTQHEPARLLERGLNHRPSPCGMLFDAGLHRLQ